MKSINKIFSFLGTISLESYLANIFLPVVLRKVGLVSFMQTFDAGNYVFYLIVVFAGVGLAYVGHIISERVLVVIQNGNRK